MAIKPQISNVDGTIQRILDQRSSIPEFLNKHLAIEMVVEIVEKHKNGMNKSSLSKRERGLEHNFVINFTLPKDGSFLQIFDTMISATRYFSVHASLGYISKPKRRDHLLLREN